MKTSFHFTLLLSLTLSACVTTRSTTIDPSTTSTKPSAPGTNVPEIVNHTPFPSVVLSAQCRSYDCALPEEYFSWSAKISFDFDQRGRLTISKHQEPSLDVSDTSENDLPCSDKGGLSNQRTSWFPYTAIFVRGGTLLSVKNDAGTALEQRALSKAENGQTMEVVGKTAREIEYFYVPCVGKHRVSAGARLDSFLPPGATLSIKSAKGQILALSLPDPTEPWVLLRYQNGAMIPVPMRTIMITIDMVERRLVAYYQSTFPVKPLLRKIELRAILPDQVPAQDETPARFRERTDAALRELRQCPIPLRPMEPCASPDRRPDLMIFSP